MTNHKEEVIQEEQDHFAEEEDDEETINLDYSIVGSQDICIGNVLRMHQQGTHFVKEKEENDNLYKVEEVLEAWKSLQMNMLSPSIKFVFSF